MRTLTFFFAFFLMGQLLPAQTAAQFGEDRLIVKFKPNVQIQLELGQPTGNFRLDALLETHKVLSIKYLGSKKMSILPGMHPRISVLRFQEKQDILLLINAFMATGLFEYVEPDYIGYGGGQMRVLLRPNDAHYDRQWGLSNDGSFSLSPATAGADIQMEDAWNIEQGSSDITVAILDSGIKLDHPEFDGRMWTNASEIAGNGMDDDNNGFVDDVNGWDFAYTDNDPDDAYGHGSNVAGIVAATGNNSIGYAGIDWNCKVMAVKILNDENWGYFSWWADAIYYAVDNGADVMNMSVGGAGGSSTLQDAVDYAYNSGTIIVACMMNFNQSTPYYPAAYTHTIAVGSTNADDTRSDPFFWDVTSGSNYGSHIDVVAPGNYIYGLDYDSDTNYNSYWGGTSQAAPHVTGLCALLLAQQARTPDEIRQVIRNTAEDQVGDASEDTAGFDDFFGYGRINAYRALSSLMVDTDEPLNTDDLLIFPNPVAKDQILEVSIKSKTWNDYTLKLMDASGRLVRQSQTPRIDVSRLQSGLYTILVADGIQTYSKQLIVK